VTTVEWVGLWFAVFVSAAAYDWAAANYVGANAKNRAVEAANWSSVTAIVGLVGFVGILRISAWLVVPEVVGVWVGTYAAIRRRRAGAP
jgi:hypothetical protein